MGHVFTAVRAPSTLGTFLRRFTVGHARRLDALAPHTLIGPASGTALPPGVAANARRLHMPLPDNWIWATPWRTLWIAVMTT
jgi:hypothetical protein